MTQIKIKMSQDNSYWRQGGSKEEAACYSKWALDNSKSEASAAQEYLISLAWALPFVAKWKHIGK